MDQPARCAAREVRTVGDHALPIVCDQLLVDDVTLVLPRVVNGRVAGPLDPEVSFALQESRR